MKKIDEITKWLLQGDVSIAYQTKRDILKASYKEVKQLQNNIEISGWGKRFLDKQRPDGHWGNGYYQPKWICTHYTLFDLKSLGINPNNKQCQLAIDLILGCKKGIDGGINYAKTVRYSDICINGMILNMASYFNPNHERIPEIINYILDNKMETGGWNCASYNGAVHGSLHTTISILEGLVEHTRSGVKYRRGEVIDAIKKGIEFILLHRLYKSDHTNEVIDLKMIKLVYPFRWKYDILRALDLFQVMKIDYDERMNDALEIIIAKQKKDGKWPMQSGYPGKIHFEMEKPGEASRWNTLRSMRVLNHFNKFSNCF